MYIHEAIKARTVEKPFIVREDWRKEYGDLERYVVKLLPTDTPDLCICVSECSRVPCRGWQPAARDLLADDWELAR